MSYFSKKPKKFQRLKHKYRLVILNDDTFEEKVSFKLSQLNVFVVVGISSLVLISLVIVLIAFTPLREFIPGYANVNVRKQGVENFLKSDSIELALAHNNLYIDNIKQIIQGKPIKLDDKAFVDSTVNYKMIINNPIEEDSLLRNTIETEEKYNLFSKAGSTPGNISSFIFLQPLKGMVTNRFNFKKQHFGIDVVAPKNEAIKATLDGTVIFAEWTSETGYVIQLQHADNIISIYKHNSVLHKKVGDHVKAGEVIAIIGNSGELSTGPHLHFELWYNGIPINPEDYMMF
ncbi:MAG: peptidase M23 [Flavobacteriales bacterium CG_4_9_14_3_um_filter_32_8]|nr:MAG: peptidase M23 [Flavobacteriales bacterium CG_4_9_14_3_um_filter_32_8]